MNPEGEHEDRASEVQTGFISSALLEPDDAGHVLKTFRLNQLIRSSIHLTQSKCLSGWIFIMYSWLTDYRLNSTDLTVIFHKRTLFWFSLTIKK